MTFKDRTAGGARLLAVLFGPCVQCQRPTTETAIVTDRPDVTESSIVIPKGGLQLENAITWTKDHDDKVVDLSETLVRVGLLNRTEIRLVVPNYVADLTRSSAPAGFSDIGIGMKQ